MLTLLVALASATDIADVYDNVASAVVVIETEGRELAAQGVGQAVSVEGLGSGVIVDREGYIVTAAHVIQTAETVKVRYADGLKVDAHIVTSDPNMDVALIKVDHIPADVHVAPWGDSSEMRVGQEVFVVGAPLGVDHTLTVGHLSGRRITQPMHANGDEAWELLQTDASINQGNSGGPLFNMNGEVIGVVSHILSQSGSSAGLGFAVSSNLTREVLFERSPLWTGMTGRYVSGLEGYLLNIPQAGAMLVEHVTPGSPGERMGLQGGVARVILGNSEWVLGGDVLLEVNGFSTEDPKYATKIRESLRDVKPGAKIELVVLRGGVPTTLTYKISKKDLGR